MWDSVFENVIVKLKLFLKIYSPIARIDWAYKIVMNENILTNNDMLNN